MPKRNVTKAHMEEICEGIAEGVSLTRICNERDHLPSWRTILRYVQENEDAYTQYRCLLYTSPSPRDVEESRMPSSA